MTINSHQHPSVKLVSECFVKPKHEIDAAKQIYHLGPIDLPFLNIDPIQKGLLYTLNNTSSHDIKPSSRERVVCHLLDKLKHSLSIALVHFYPLGGRFSTQVYPDEEASSIFVDCNKGSGARFIHATALGLAVSDVLSPVDVTLAHPFFDLGERYANYDGHTKALLSIQVTELQDGVFIGFSMNHSVVDGTTFVHFIDVLSEIYRFIDYSGENDGIVPISRVPIFDYRPWLSDDVSGNEDARIILKLPYFDVGKRITRGYDPGPLRERIFHFSPTSMARLKLKANQQSGAHNIVISSFQALIALVWRCITRARDLPMDKEATCFFAIGARSRFDPPASNEYFGNLVSKAQWACKVEQLLSNELDWAALNLRNLVATHDAKAVLKKYADSPCLMPRDTESDFHGSNSVIMGGSIRFNIYGPEFGLGRALAARMGFGNKQDGKVTASQGCEGNGSVDLEICLRPQTMTVLETDKEFMSFVSLN